MNRIRKIICKNACVYSYDLSLFTWLSFSERFLPSNNNICVYYLTIYLCSLSKNDTRVFRLWDVRSNKVGYTTKVKRSGYLYLAWNPAIPDILAAVHQDNEIVFVDARAQKILATLGSPRVVSLSNLSSVSFFCISSPHFIHKYIDK